VNLFAPLRALRPPPDRAAEVAELPYDVMDRAEAVAMAAGRPNSFLHVSRPDIDLPPGARADSPEGLALAASAFARLQAEGLLARDEAPAFHAYRMTREGQAQTGVVGVADVAAYDRGRIRRHETTRPAKQADRAAHIDALDAQTGPVLLIHRPDPRIARLLAEATSVPAPTALTGPGGVAHELWPIADEGQVAALAAAFDAQEALYIADGHHRSAAASMVHGRRCTPASGGFLAVSFPSDEVRILPYNRLVRAPSGTPVEAILDGIGARCTLEPAAGPVTPAAPGRFGLYLAGRWYRVTAPDALRRAGDPVEQLDVALLQRHVLEPVLGVSDPRTDPRIEFVGGVRPLAELEAAVDGGGWTAAFSMHPTTVEDLMGVADAGGIMPPKSTWFEPKLLDGLVTHVLA
jgi:uncharacterized protein (DUF1015 family)